MGTFLTTANRDASAVIRGYVYQVNLTILQWLHLAPEEKLVLECGEDIDLVRAAVSGEEDSVQRLLQQVKHRKKPLTLRSSEAIEALVNFRRHIESNPGHNLLFRYVTNTTVGLERPPLTQDRTSALLLWQRLKAGDIDGSQVQQYALSDLSQALLKLTRPSGIDPSAWSRWRNFLTTATPEVMFDFIRKVDWATGQASFDELEGSVRTALLAKGCAASAEQAKAAHEKLFLYVFKLLSQSGVKQLAATDLDVELKRETEPRDFDLLSSIRELLDHLGQRVASVESRIDELDAKVSVVIAGPREQTVDYGTAPPLDIPPSVAYLTARKASVRGFLERADHASWLSIHGNVGSGKTQFAILLVELLGNCRAWLRLRNLTPEQACCQIEAMLHMVSGVRPVGNRRDWYNRVCTETPGSTFVLDDLPLVPGDNSVLERLIEFTASCHSTGVRLVSTSAQRLPAKAEESLGKQALFESLVPPFTDEEIRELLIAYDAPEEVAGQSTLFAALTNSHPVVLVAAARYLRSRNWDFSKEAVTALLHGEHAKRLNLETQGLLLGTVSNADDRELLYRLSLALRPFSAREVTRICTVSPPLTHPLERLSASVGLWIQNELDGVFVTSPLLAQLKGANLTEETRKEVHRQLAEAILETRKVDPLGAHAALCHFLEAGAPVKAALVLQAALAELGRLPKSAPDWGFTGIWYDTELPTELSLLQRLAVRVGQIMACHKREKRIDGLLSDLDALLDQCGEEEAVMAATVSFAAILPTCSADAGRACRYLVRVVRAVGDGVLELKSFTGAPPGILNDLFWIAGVDSAKQGVLDDWFSMAKSLDHDFVLGADKDSELALDAYDLVVNPLWLAEEEKPDTEQDWRRVADRLEHYCSQARELGLERLWATYVWAIGVVMGEHLRDLDGMLARVSAALTLASNDPYVQFLIREVAGRQLLLAGRTSDAEPWLSVAVKLELVGWSSKRVKAYLMATEAVGAVDSTSAARYAQTAVDIATSAEDLSEAELVRAFGEYAIALWLCGNLRDAFAPLSQVALRVLKKGSQDTLWRGLLVVTGHVSGYLSSMASTGKPPRQYTSETEYVPPRSGLFGWNTDRFAAYYAGCEWAIASHLATLAEALELDEEALDWSLRAFDMASEAQALDVMSVLAPDAMVFALLNKEYGTVLDLAMQASSAGIALSLALEQGTKPSLGQLDVSATLGHRPNEAWVKVDSRAALIGLVPIVFRLATIALDSGETAQAEAEEVATICRQMAPGLSRPEVWLEAARLLERAFAPDVDCPTLIGEGNMARNLDSSLQVIAYVGASLKGTPEGAVQAHLALMPLIQGFFAHMSSLYRRIIASFMKAFWKSTFYRSRFRFTSPRTTEQLFAEALQTPTADVIRRLLAVAASSLNVRLDPEAKTWLSVRR